MKVKRYKRAQRILTVYRHNFGFNPPYRVLMDGTFAMAALQNKINLREQMPKYLNEEVEICVTKCVLNELEKLGDALYGALHICKQFTIDPCPHEPLRSASECIRHMARRMESKTKYLIATQDNALTDSLRQLRGAPILFIKYKGILIDKVSEATMEALNRPKDDLNAINQLKRKIIGDDEDASVKRKKRKIKGPNPLSMKKKKKRPVVSANAKGKNGTVKKRRHRKYKKGGGDAANSNINSSNNGKVPN
ncbi:unnamed protein product [Anisakis simplex]|uniref:rRNA-processing protein UTP23 homolog n=1 Tax=Anisakis simplex TaxID=6269 RepID=A0A0M3JRR2_ANISI|nr:unnamed protein product [Anisakis simplex]